MDNLTYQRLVTAIRYEIIFWSLLILSTVTASDSVAWSILPLVTSVVVWIDGTRLDAKWKKLQEEAKS